MTVDAVPLIIVGAGGLGRETAACIRAVNAASPHTWDLLGFADDGRSPGDPPVDGLEVIGTTTHLAAAMRDSVRTPSVVVSTGRPGATGSRRMLARRFSEVGASFATVVHPSAALSAGSSVGPGSVLLAQVVVTAPVAIGRHVVMMPHVVITHDDRIGDFTTFGAGAVLAGGVSIGDGAYIGSGASIRENVSVGAGALVGMGSVVLRDIPPDEVWVGNPARPLRTTTHAAAEGATNVARFADSTTPVRFP